MYWTYATLGYLTTEGFQARRECVVFQIEKSQKAKLVLIKQVDTKTWLSTVLLPVPCIISLENVSQILGALTMLVLNTTTH